MSEEEDKARRLRFYVWSMWWELPGILEQGSGTFNVEVSKYDSYKTMRFTKGKKIK